MTRRTLAALAALAALSTLDPRSAHAQRVVEHCETRHCITAPCPQPPCRPSGQVERSGREVRVTLDGRVLRYEVTERWTNTGRTIGEVDYVLPLPRGAAFEDLALEIDGELVTGEALGAGEARRIYEEIVRRQRDPALVEWMDLGVLRTRIFPIQPGETRSVRVRFRAVAEREGNALRVDVPAPRGSGTMGSGSSVRLIWPAGADVGDAWSPTHDVTLLRSGSRRSAQEAVVEDATGTVTLLLPLRTSGAASITTLTHAPGDGAGYVLLTLTPPATSGPPAARDITFVIDVSGSMSGGKLEQAQAAGRQLLATLSPRDRFRLIAFSGDVADFREGWTTATPEARREAAAWLAALEANGGTNIGGALERALEMQSADGRLGLVLFLTDGAPTVGERRPERLAARAGSLRGERRVFTFGIGADVNAVLLEQLALDGAGTAHFVRPEEDVERVVGVVAQRITRPVATDLRIRATGVSLSRVMPAGTIDLFAGQELTVLARYTGSATSGRIIITGQGPAGPVRWEATAAFPARRTQDAFVGRLWATQRVGWLTAERRRNGASTELDTEIKQLGERWGIPTELTSYLVLEPGMSTPQASSTGRGGRGVAMAPSPPPPPAVFEQARQAAAMRAARSEAALEKLADASGPPMRRTAQRAFVLRDSVWTDTRDAASAARSLRVQPYSEAYFALMQRIPELQEVFALGDRVEVRGRAVTIQLAADGRTSLASTEMAALTRDW